MGSLSRVIHDGMEFGILPLDRRSCQLLGPTALIVQALMGMLAVLSLVYKRHRETQKRPWKIWLFDVSKQVLGQLFVHGLNVLISDLGSHHSSGNACTYYFLNILLDTTLGVGLIYPMLQFSTWLLSKKLGIKGLKSGQYGTPPSVTYWARQTAVYVCGISTMKLLVVALFVVWPGISAIGDWLLSWTDVEDGEMVQVIFVMGIFPIFMNVIQFWLIDSIVKASSSPPPSIRSSSQDSQDREPLFHSPDDDDNAAPPDIEHGPRSSSSRTLSDGDSKTFVSPEDKVKLSASGSSSPITLPTTPGVVTQDHLPNSDNSTVSSSSQGNTRSRHRFRRSSSSLVNLPIPSSPPATDPMRHSLRQTLASKSLDVVATAQFDALEKHGGDDEGRRNNARGDAS